MKALFASVAALIGATLPAMAHTDSALPLHAHPHGSELLLALPLIAAAGIGIYLLTRR